MLLLLPIAPADGCCSLGHQLVTDLHCAELSGAAIGESHLEALKAGMGSEVCYPS